MKKMYNTLKLLLVLLIGLQVGAAAQTTTFSAVGTANYTVPAGVTGITVTVKGAQGGQNSDELDYNDRAGYGGCVTAFISVTPGQVLNVNVGGCGGAGTSTTGGAGGFNGGGNGSYGVSVYSGGGGGGASDIRLSPFTTSDRIVVAGGGGGAGLNCGSDNDRGGDGGSNTGTGGETGAAGCGTSTGGGGGPFNGTGGIGGTCAACGGSAGFAGDNFTGGNGGNGSAGGGGGGGLSAGGGGQWTGGGGGSDYYAPGVTVITESRGCNAACGSVSITVSCIAGAISGPNQVCVGATNPSLTETVGGGTWTSSDNTLATVGSSTGKVTGVAAGVVTITYTLSSYCHTTYSVTVNPLPAAITGSTTLCKNQTATLHESTPGITWSSDNTTIATIGSTTGVVTAVNAGTCNIITTITATGCFLATPFLVNPVPAPVVGADTVCVGSSVVITDISAGGTWSSTLPGTASIVGAGTTATVTGASAGTTAVISYTFPATGCAAAFPMTVNALPSGIGGPNIVCLAGPAVVETDITSGGSWSSSPITGNVNINSTSGAVTGVALGTAMITYTLPTGCYVTRIITINPMPSPISPSSPQVCTGLTITLTDPTLGGTWSSATTAVGTIAGAGTTGTVTGIATGGGTTVISYTLNGCAATVVVTVNPKPVVITGPADVCAGDCSEIYASGPSAGTWSSSTSATGTIDPATGTFCALAAGTTTLTFTYTATGCLRNKNVTVNPIPVISPASPQVCLNDSVQLTAVPAAGTWSTPGPEGSIDATTGYITGLIAGTTTVTYTAATTCTANVVVTVNTNPNAIVETSGTNPMCALSSATLSSPGSPAGTWISSNIGAETINPATGAVTGGAIGGIVIDTFKVTGTGCYAIYSMTVNSLPTFGAPPPATMCQATSTGVLANGGAGLWTSSNSGVVQAVDAGGGVGTLNALSVGSSNVCFTFSSAPGCQLCQTVNVIAAAGPISGPSSVCTGRTITLTDPPGTGTWTSSDPTAASVGSATGIVTGNSTTGSPVVITYSLGSGCFATKTITVNQSPNAITGTTSICLGQSTTLCTTAYGPAGYTWSSGTMAVATIASAGGLCITATSISAGTTIISYTNNFTGCYSSVPLVVTNGVSAISGPDFVCMGSTVVETETVNGNWSSSSGGIANVTGVLPAPAVNNTTVTPVSPGVFTLTFVATSGCSTSKTMTVDALPLTTVVPLGSTNLCPGGVVDLTASTGTGYTYQWLNPGAIPGATSSTYIAGAAGNYSVFVSTGFCSATSAATLVTMNPINPTVTASGLTTTCASSPVTLTASAAATYQWELGGVAISGANAATFTPTVSGSYTVVESNAFGCTGTSAPMVVNYVPSPGGVVTLSGPLNICAGNSVTITADAGTGYTYQWYNGAGAIAGATNISYTASVSGTYHFVDTNPLAGCSTTSANSVVVVSPLPAATITAGSSTVFCTGGSVALAAPASVGNAYQWYSNGVLIAGATNAVYVAGTTGNYTVVVDSPASGCIATSPVKTVTEVTTPYINMVTPSTFCWGGSADLAAIIVSGAGSVGYQWTLGGVNIPGATNNTYAATVSGSYAVQISVASGLCTTASTPVTVTEKPLPNPSVSYDGTNLHAQTYYVSYVWYLNTVLIPGANTATTPAIGNGAYKVKVTDTNGCQAVSAGFPLSGWVSNSTTNISNGNGDIRIYPNPAQDALHIESAAEVRAVIIGIDGRTMIDQPNAKTVDISRLANGIYTIKLYSADGHMLKVEKLVKDGN